MKPHREPGSRESGFVTQQDVLRACASELKMACLDLLAEGPMCVSDMIPRLGWTQPEISRALVALRELGLVEFVVRTRHHLYRLGRAVRRVAPRRRIPCHRDRPLCSVRGHG